MLKKFLLNTLSSFVGTWLAFLLFTICAVIIGVSIAVGLGGDTEQVSLKKHSILTLELSGTIEETEVPSVPDYMSLINGDLERPQTLNVIVESLREAAKNKSVDALYLKCGALAASPATVNAIRDAVIDFKKSGKKIYSYGDVYTLGTYYIASAADSLFINPYGEVAIQGLGSTSLYLKGLFDKLGVQFQVVKVGTFKSAVEPYISTEMSEPARAQLDTLFSTMWDFMKTGICQQRKKLTPALLDSLVNSGLAFTPSDMVVKEKLVDKAVYERTMDDRLARLAGVEKKKLNFVNPSTLITQVPWSDAYSSKDRIAVLYATGEIVDGAPTGINFEKLVPIITRLADDKDVKGMVLRVNSPGGSAFGSDQIGEALDYFQSKKKPLAVSMGDYAASGGYWISCHADRIFADPLTITGSIGIFGLIPNVKGLADKFGVSPQTVATNPRANFPTMFAPLDEAQLAIMQKYVERGYDRFVNRVATGRKMSDSAVRKIAEGRVWNAMKAKEIGLVDELGSLRQAIEWVARKSGVAGNYNAAAYPEYEPNFWDMIYARQLEMRAAITKGNAGEYKDLALKVMNDLLTRHQIQARMPEFKVTTGK